MNAAKTGLVPKYNVTKADGSPCDPGSYYFLLRIDSGGEKAHVKACRAAWRVYADQIGPTLPLLAKDIYNQLSILEKQELKLAELNGLIKQASFLGERIHLLTPEEHKSVALSTMIHTLTAAESSLQEVIKQPLNLK